MTDTPDPMPSLSPAEFNILLDEACERGRLVLDNNIVLQAMASKNTLLHTEESTEMKIETGVTMITDGFTTKRASLYSDDDLIRLIAAEKEKYKTLLEIAEGTTSKAMCKRLLIHDENVKLLVDELDGRMEDEPTTAVKAS